MGWGGDGGRRVYGWEGQNRRLFQKLLYFDGLEFKRANEVST